MSKREFTDADGDTYNVELAKSGNILLTYTNSEESGATLFVFKAEDADRLATMILDAAKEARR